jgi:hypothetical protein
MHRAHAFVSLPFVGCFVLAACGGVTTDGHRSDRASAGGGETAAGASGDDGGASSGGAEFAGGPSSVAAGGTGGRYPTESPPPAKAPPAAAGGALPIIGSSGGATGGAVSVLPPVDSGPSCQNVFSPMEWRARCAPSDRCLNLDPASWSSAADAPDASVDAGGGEDGPDVVEMRFCGAPWKKQRYLFAFEESGASYDAFNVVTGD